MMNVPQLTDSLNEIKGSGDAHKHIADITAAWVNGKSIKEIAEDYFKGDDTKKITEACRPIYRNLINTGTWGLSALSKLSGIDFDKLDASEQRRINAMPAMLYHGVRSEEAVLMRMNAIPRSISERLGKTFRKSFGADSTKATVQDAREFIKSMTDTDWNKAAPDDSALQGRGYKKIWQLLSGEGSQ